MGTQKNNLNATKAFKILKDAGYPASFVKKFLPDWWDSSLLSTASGALQFALFTKQRFGIEVHFDSEGNLTANQDTVIARFKHRKSTNQNELSVVKNLGKAASELAAHIVKEYSPLPNNPEALRDYILSKYNKNHIDFETLLEACWDHGLPVLFLDAVPQTCKRMTGMVVKNLDRPTVILGFRDRQKARQLFILAHEIGHISLGHVEDNSSLIDEDLDTSFDTLNNEGLSILDKEEREADQFALNLIRGNSNFSFDNHNFFGQPTDLILFSVEEGRAKNIDPGHIIQSYAFITNDWTTASKASKYLTHEAEALTLIRSKFFEHADLDSLGTESKEYLLKLQGF